MVSNGISCCVFFLVFSDTLSRRSTNEVVHACEGSIMTLSCPRNTVINIEWANYGRLSVDPCADENSDTQDWNIHCTSSNTIERIQTL